MYLLLLLVLCVSCVHG